MAKRRDSQTSVTIWLDPKEVQALDSIRGDATRSAWATKVARARLSATIAADDRAADAASRAASPPAPPEMIEAAARAVRARAHDRRVRPELTLSAVVQAVELRRSGLHDHAIARRLRCLPGALSREGAPVDAAVAPPPARSIPAPPPLGR